jgi:RNA recognition motif-containing protein
MYNSNNHNNFPAGDYFYDNETNYYPASSNYAPASLRLARSIFVGDLSFFCTEIELASAFEKFGTIVSLEIKRGRFGDSLMHGFVEYDNEASATTAIQEMNGKKFMGRKMRVNWTNTKVTNNKDLDQWIQVHVNFLTTNVSKFC